MKLISRFGNISTGLLCAMALISFTLNAGDVKLNNNKNDIRITENTGQGFIVSFSFSEFKSLDVKTPKGIFSRIIVPSYARTGEFGYPELPVKSGLIEIPANALARVRIVNFNVKEFKLADLGIEYPLMPNQPPVPKTGESVEFVYEKSAYKVNAFSSVEIVSVEPLGTMRGVNIGRLDILPVQYNPVSGMIRVYENLEIEVTFENADLAATELNKQIYSNHYFSPVFNSLLNYREPANGSRENFSRYPIKYVIVADRMFEAQLQPLIEWKVKKGFTVIEAYTDDPNVGTTTFQIKAYLQSLYDNATTEDPAPTFVLFVGDIAQLPTWTGLAAGHVTDLFYCEYTGDYFPEVFYGRFSAQNPDQLQPQVDKTLMVEQYTMPMPGYLDTVVMIAGMDGTFGPIHGNGQINYGTENYFNASNGIYSHTYLYPESGGNAANIRQNISDGVTFANYTAHGSPDGWADPSFSVGHIPALQNDDKYGLLIGNCCSTSEYQVSECFGEAIVRAANKGAVGYIGASNSTFWDEDYYFGVGVGEISGDPPSYEETTLGSYDRAFHTHGELFGEWYTTMDQMIFAGNLAVTEGSPGSAQYYWEAYNLMGDPSLMIYFSEPPAMEVTYVPLIPMGGTTFTVNAAPYAYVAVSINGTGLGTALADINGLAVVNLVAPPFPGNADVVVTAQNYQPFIGTVLIANPEGPYILLSDHETYELSGYSNFKIECGEVIAINIELRNYGLSDGTSVDVILSSSDQYITITDSHENCGTVPAQSAVTIENAFSIVIDEYIPDGYEVEFMLSIVDASMESWESGMKLLLSAPVLNLFSFVVDDTEAGNGNGRLDAGENADIIATFSNSGHAIARNTTANLCAHSGFINITNPDYSIGNLGLFGNTPVTFNVEVDDKAPDGILADFMVNLVSGEFELHEVRSLEIGLISENFETGDFNAFNWDQSGNLPWTITDSYPFEGMFSARSGAINHGESSEVSISYYVMKADSISFYRKVSSEQADKLKFLINGALAGEWSGTIGGWKRESFYVSPGNHIFKWIYTKDASGSIGADAGWIDYIVFPPPMATTIYAGEDAAVCVDDEFQCLGAATNFQHVSWMTSGSGIFDNNVFLTPIYTPSEEDHENGSVTLTMNIIDTQGEAFNDELSLTFREGPGQPGIPGGPGEVMLDTAYTSEYSIGTVEGADSYIWIVSPPEAGYLTGCDESGIIVWNRDFAGIVAIITVAVNACGESVLSEELQVIVENSTVSIFEPEEAKFGLSVYPNPSDGIFNIVINGANPEDVEIRLVDIMGKAHRIGEPLDPGIYVLIAETGNQRVVHKLIIR